MIYEWGSEKAAENQRKHGVSFDEASSVFLDPLALTFDDPDHSLSERSTIGVTSNQRLVFVAHVEEDDDRIRIISARETTRRETYEYQERSRKNQ